MKRKTLIILILVIIITFEISIYDNLINGSYSSLEKKIASNDYFEIYTDDSGNYKLSPLEKKYINKFQSSERLKIVDKEIYNQPHEGYI